VDFDPSDSKNVIRNLDAINAVILRAAQRGWGICRGDTSTDPCREYKRIVRTYNLRRPPVQLQWTGPAMRPTTAKADCSVGFCYRHTLPYTVELTMLGSSAFSYTYQLPNGSPLVAMDINRAITVTKTTKIEFGDLGQMTSIRVQKGYNDG